MAYPLGEQTDSGIAYAYSALEVFISVPHDAAAMPPSPMKTCRLCRGAHTRAAQRRGVTVILEIHSGHADRC